MYLDVPAARFLSTPMTILIRRDGADHGPFPLKEVRKQLAEGLLTGSEMVWVKGGSKWMPLRQCLSIAGAEGPSEQSMQGIFLALGVVMLLAAAVCFSDVGDSLSTFFKLMEPPPAAAPVAVTNQLIGKTFQTGSDMSPRLGIRFISGSVAIILADGVQVGEGCPYTISGGVITIPTSCSTGHYRVAGETLYELDHHFSLTTGS